jgi:hypothetical protein
MYYIEVLRTWRFFWRYIIVVVGLYLLLVTLATLLPSGHGAATHGMFSVGGHAVLVAFVCLLFASIAGTSLSRHLDHLDFALTKPRSRATFVATVFGIDALGLAVFFIVTAIAFLALHIALGETHSIVFDAASSFGVLLAFGSVLAWYAIVQAVSCARDSSGWALGGVWVAGLGVLFLDAAPIAPGLHAIVVAANWFNPIAYLTTVPFMATTGPASLSLAAHAVAIYVVAGVAGLIALIRWQRVEI